MPEHHFFLTADWPGRRNSSGTITAGHLKTDISIPVEMGGPGIGTNPDEMLLGAAATCYIISLAALLERAGIEVKSLQQQSEAIVEVENGIFTYKKIIHRPVISLQTLATDKERKLAEKLARKAEKTCMISKAVKGNVEIALEATIH